MSWSVGMMKFPTGFGKIIHLWFNHHQLNPFHTISLILHGSLAVWCPPISLEKQSVSGWWTTEDMGVTWAIISFKEKQVRNTVPFRGINLTPLDTSCFLNRVPFHNQEQQWKIQKSLYQWRFMSVDITYKSEELPASRMSTSFSTC